MLGTSSQNAEISESDLDNISSILGHGNSRSQTYEASVVYSENSLPCLYVLNFNDGGWAVVSATRNYKPILAFSSTGSIDLNEILPEGLDIWKESMVQTISNIEKVVPEDSIKLYRSEWERISPMSVSSRNYDTPISGKSTGRQL